MSQDEPSHVSHDAHPSSISPFDNTIDCTKPKRDDDAAETNERGGYWQDTLNV